MAFLEGEIVILNADAIKGLPSRVGERCEIIENNYRSNLYDYKVRFDDGETAPVKSSELNKLTEEDKKWMDYIFTGNKVLHNFSGEIATVKKVDYLLSKVEIDFVSGGTIIVDFESLMAIDEESDNLKETDKQGKFTEIGLEIGKFTDKKNKQYGSSVDATYEIIKVLMERYKNNDSTYTIPESLLQHILLQVRMMDKQNRIFNNPSGEGDSESPYNDLAGYSLIGIDMVNNK